MTGFKRVLVLGTAAAAMAAGALLGAVGSASAETVHHPVGGVQRVQGGHCDARGVWTWQRSRGHWVRVWHRADRDCRSGHGQGGHGHGDGGHGRG